MTYQLNHRWQSSASVCSSIACSTPAPQAAGQAAVCLPHPRPRLPSWHWKGSAWSQHSDMQTGRSASPSPERGRRVAHRRARGDPWLPERCWNRYDTLRQNWGLMYTASQRLFDGYTEEPEQPLESMDEPVGFSDPAQTPGTAIRTKATARACVCGVDWDPCNADSQDLWSVLSGSTGITALPPMVSMIGCTDTQGW